MLQRGRAPGERGIAASSSLPAKSAPLQRGRAPGERGIWLTPWILRRGKSCFNGAALRGSAESRDDVADGAPLRALQRGRAPGERGMPGRPGRVPRHQPPSTGPRSGGARNFNESKPITPAPASLQRGRAVSGGANADEKRRFQNLSDRRVEKQTTGSSCCRFCARTGGGDRIRFGFGLSCDSWCLRRRPSRHDGGADPARRRPAWRRC